MIGRWIEPLRRLKPGAVIVTILLIEAVLVFVVTSSVPSPGDKYYGLGFADDYDGLAQMISQGYGYRLTPDSAATLIREPGYPLILAGLFRLFGFGILAVRLVNLICAGLAAWLLSRLTARLSSSQLAPLVATILFLVHPGVVIAELRGGVEIIFTLLCLIVISALYSALAARTYLSYLYVGVLLGLTSLVRSTALLFPAFLPFIFFFVESPRPSLSTAVKRLAIVAISATVMLSPWMLRNFLLVGSPVPTASVQGIAAHVGEYICQHISADTGFQALDFESARLRVELARQQGYSFEDGGYYLLFRDPHDEVGFNSWLSKRVLADYERSPSLFAKCTAENAFNFWFAGKNWTSTFWNAIVQVPYLVLAIWGLVAYSRAVNFRPLAIVIAFCVYTMLVYMPIHAQARYSVPLVPFLALLAAAGLAPKLDGPKRAATIPV
jgi:4-amino-4-deoxy-L-arabinose transferase-like glycosyltransferase